MKYEIFMAGLVLVSALTNLTVEVIKKHVSELSIKVHPTMLAAIVSTVLSIAVSCGYVVYSGIGFTVQVTIAIVGLVYLSWLCATLGYDNVHNALKKLKGGSIDE